MPNNPVTKNRLAFILNILGWSACLFSLLVLAYELFCQVPAIIAFGNSYPRMGLIIPNMKKLLSFSGGYWNLLQGLFFLVPSASLAIASGNLLLKKIIGEQEGEYGFIRFSAGYALGLVFIGYIFGLCGMLGFVNVWLARILYLLGILSMPVTYKLCRKAFKNLFAEENGGSSPLLTNVLKYFVLFWIAILFSACVTSVADYDVLQHHWGYITTYVNEGTLKPNPYNLLSYFPQNAEMIYMWQFLLNSEVAAKMFNFTSWLFIALTVVAVAQLKSDGWSAWFAGALFVLMPVSIWTSYTPKNDSMLALLIFLAILNLSNTFSGDRNDFIPELSKLDNGWKHFFLCGIWVGAALGTKYIALHLFALSTGALFFFLHFKEKFPLRKTCRCITVFFLGASIFSTLWYIRNVAETLNPIYPFLSTIFPTHFVKEWHIGVTQEMLTEGTKYWSGNKLSGFIKCVLGAGCRENLQAWFSPLSVTLFPFLLALIAIKDTSLKWIAYLSILTLVLGMSNNPNFRMFLGQIALICSLLVVSVGRTTLTRHRLRRALSIAALLLVINPSNRWAYENLNSGLFSLLNGVDTNDMTHAVGGETLHINELEVVKRYINSTFPKESRILFIGEKRTAGFFRKHYSGSGRDISIVEDWAGNCRTTEELNKVLRNYRVTHLLVVPSGFGQISSQRVQELLHEFIGGYCKLIIETENKKVQIYILK